MSFYEKLGKFEVYKFMFGIGLFVLAIMFAFSKGQLGNRTNNNNNDN